MLIPKEDSGNAIMKGNVLFDHMCTYRNVQHASAKGKKGTDEDEPTLMRPSDNLCIDLYPDLLKSIQPNANQLLLHPLHILGAIDHTTMTDKIFV